MTDPNAIAAGPVTAGTPAAGKWRARPCVHTTHWLVCSMKNARLTQLARVYRREDAALMASAPDLLAAAEAMLAWHDSQPLGTLDLPVVLAMRAAVQRAKGERT